MADFNGFFCSGCNQPVSLNAGAWYCGCIAVADFELSHGATSPGTWALPAVEEYVPQLTDRNVRAFAALKARTAHPTPDSVSGPESIPTTGQPEPDVPPHVRTYDTALPEDAAATPQAAMGDTTPSATSGLQGRGSPR